MNRWILQVLPIALAFAGLSARAQFLYEVSCNDVVKLDAASGRQIAAVDLATKTTLIPSESPRTAFCDLGEMTYDAAHHSAALEVNDRAHHVYRRLTFSIPEFRLMKASRLKRAWHEDGDDEAGGMEAPMPRLPGTLTQGSESGWLNLSGYQVTGDLAKCTASGEGKILLSKPVAEAGHGAVLKATCTEGTRLFVARADPRQIRPLELPPEAGLAALFVTSDRRYLLATGRGARVKVGGGKAWLVDLTTGSLVHEWSDPRLMVGAFLGFTAHALLFSGQPTDFVLDAPVSFSPSPEGGGFFADR